MDNRVETVYLAIDHTYILIAIISTKLDMSFSDVTTTCACITHANFMLCSMCGSSHNSLMQFASHFAWMHHNSLIDCSLLALCCLHHNLLIDWSALN